MKVGIVANIMQDKTLAEALDYFENGNPDNRAGMRRIRRQVPC